jgi:hypothetical protein
LIISPFKPNDAETKAAQEFFGVTMEGYSLIAAKGGACGLAMPKNETEEFGDANLALADKVSAILINPQTHWQKPPVMTILPVISNSYPCETIPETTGDEIEVNGQ